MTSSVFNTQFEVSLRVLLSLEASEQAAGVDRIAAVDFMSSYSKEFGFAEANLHGDNDYMFSEFAVRRSLVSESVKKLVVRRYLDVVTDGDGFCYKLSPTGMSFCDSLTSDYSDKYYQVAKRAWNSIAGISDHDVLLQINSKALNALRKRRQ